MKIKYFQLLIVSLFFALAANAQQQLYSETFNNATNTFTLNDTIVSNTGFGTNKWIVDSNYFGGGIYPNTVNENNTFGGTINGAPYSKYLHIYDSASGYLNDNYNPSVASDRLAHMTSGICTWGITNVNVQFYYLCQGSHTAYGELVYSINEGPWVQDTNKLKYDSTYKWKFVSLKNPAFNNIPDLRIGFRWINNDTTGRDTSAMGVDDILIYGSADTAQHITCKWSFQGWAYDSCLGTGATVYFIDTLSDTLCDAVWDMDMSGPTGLFPGPYDFYQTTGGTVSYWYLQIPNSYNIPGHCYKFKLVRTTFPFYTFEDSICIPFDSCPGKITTLQPVVTMDSNAVCVGSVIAVTFNSTDIYDTNNVYFAQLLDSTTVVDTLGHLISMLSYPSLPPGSITGRIPLNTPPGCKYYVRVVSTTPDRQAFEYGPFCIQHCEILTDTSLGSGAGWPTNLQVCLNSCYKSPHGFTDTLPFNIRSFDSTVHYKPGNKFEVQVLSPMTFAAINTGGFGVIADTLANRLIIHIPCSDSLTRYFGIAPGAYYMRIVATNPNYSDSAFGAVIFLTIGELPDSMYLTDMPASTTFCLGTTITFNTNPDDQYTINSTYQWWISENNQIYSFGGWNYGYLGYTPPTVDTFLISCQEQNNGCFGPVESLPDSVDIMGKPNTTITGPFDACVGDTLTYSVPFLNKTFYIWSANGQSILYPGGNTVKIVFDSAGICKIGVFGSDSCYTASGNRNVHIYAHPVPKITVSPKDTFCIGNSVTLTASGLNATSYKWSTGKNGSTLKVTPQQDTTYVLTASNLGCSAKDSASVTVYPLPVVVLNPSVVMACYGDTTKLIESGAQTYGWTPNSGLLFNDSLVKVIITENQTYTVVGTNAEGCTDTTTANAVLLLPSGTITTPASSFTQGGSVVLVATGGSKYSWTPDSGLSCYTCGTPTASPSSTTTYTVLISDSDGCFLRDTVTVEVVPTCNVFVPDAFTPGNPSGENAILYVRSECLANMDFVIYDRWGNKVFESKDPSVGWNGSFNNNGVPMNRATFVYYLTATAKDGRTFTKKGNIALIR
jgi:gliding motility-associated-like protein